jgi:hypothetical protein
LEIIFREIRFNGYGTYVLMFARKSATLVTFLNANGLVGNISATRKATKSYIIVIAGKMGLQDWAVVRGLELFPFSL